MSADWESVTSSGFRERRAASGLPQQDELVDEGEPLFTERRQRYKDSAGCFSTRGCWIMSITVFLIFAVTAYTHWRFPKPLSCSVAQVRPQKFKIDVTHFFAPHLSAAVQLVLAVHNGNALRTLLLDGVTLSVYEAGTGLKLGSGTQGSFMVGAMTDTQVTVAVARLGSALPPPQQQRIASDFLTHKALLLTFVVTATSRLPIKGSKTIQTSSNTTRRVDLAGLYKDPFFSAPPHCRAAASIWR